jgi:hypothetical protein
VRDAPLAVPGATPAAIEQDATAGVLVVELRQVIAELRRGQDDVGARPLAGGAETRAGGARGDATSAVVGPRIGHDGIRRKNPLSGVETERAREHFTSHYPAGG